MDTLTLEQLTAKRCIACEGGLPELTPAEVEAHLAAVPQWHLTHESERIRRDWWTANFLAGIDFFLKVTELAQREGHHPDLHLENYCHVWIEIWTHAVGGLTENDFILAAKIDQLPIKVREES